MTRRWVAFFSIALAGAGLDLLTKWLAFSRCSAGETITVVPHLLWIQLATNRGIAWGLFPLLYASHGLTVGQIGVLAAVYPAVWGAGQLATVDTGPGAPDEPGHRLPP